MPNSKIVLIFEVSALIENSAFLFATSFIRPTLCVIYKNNKIKKRNIFLSILIALISLASIFLYINKDKFVYLGSVDIIEVDCSKKVQILNDVYESDQKIRKANDLLKHAKEDHRNQELVISIIEKCGMPTLKDVSQKHMNAIWLGLQHSNKRIIKKYFPQVEKAVKMEIYLKNNML